MNESIISSQQCYWADKSRNTGSMVRAVGSESTAHKYLRYRQVSQIFGNDADFSILDVGAGVGDFFGFIKDQFASSDILYTGVEITDTFCQQAKAIHPDITMHNIDILTERISTFDYVIMSGIFHQNGPVPADDWVEFMERMLARGFELCRKGLAFNVLNDSVDFKRDGNFHPDSQRLQKFIRSRLSRFFVIDQATPLFETTFLVYHKDTVSSKYPQPEFKKYL